MFKRPTSPSRKRFAIPAALAVSMISCGPAQVSTDAGNALLTCDGGTPDGSTAACGCDCSTCQGECPVTEFLSDGGLINVCACEPLV